MDFKYPGFRKTVNLLTFSVLFLLVYSSSISIAVGQKKPTTLKLDVDVDDEKLCSQAPLSGTRFCDLFKKYTDYKDGSSPELAVNARNDMIEIVRGQVDTYYKLRKDGRRTKIRFFQTVLDFLEIGGAGAIAIMNGARAKTITGVAIGMLQGGRTTFNKNFEILQTQVLINKMNTNRARILTEIYGSIDKPVRGKKPSDGYSWYAAKNDLKRYLFAGTFDDALDSLVEQTGAEVADAEEDLRIVEKGLTVGEIPEDFLVTTRKATIVLTNLEADLSNNQKKDAALSTLRAIVTTLNNKGGRIKTELSAAGVTASSAGGDIITSLRNIKSKLLDEGEDTLINTIDQTIVDITGNN